MRALLYILFYLYCFSCSESDMPPIEPPTIEEDSNKIAYINGNIYTGYDMVEMMILEEGIINFVGEMVSEELESIPSEQIIDLEGKFVMSGIHDVHLHPLEAASDNFQFILSEVEYAEDYATQVEEAFLENMDKDWILGWGFDLELMLEAEELPKTMLDDISTDVPIAIMELTSHSIWVNSKALELARYTDDSENPIGGVLMREEDGELNGILLDNAGNLIIDLALPTTETSLQNDYLGLKDFALPELAKYGITSVCDARTYWKRGHHETWKKLENNDELTVRANLGLWAYPNEDDDEQLSSLKVLYENEDESLLKINQIKLYSDGIVHNTTSAMHKDYKLDLLGEMTNNGLNYFTQERIEKYIAELEPLGFDFHIHAIGDRGIHESLNAIEVVGTSNGRHRITHTEYVNPEDYERFTSLNVTADAQVAGDFTQPDHWHDFDHLIDGALSENYIPLRILQDNGSRITLSSDWDVSTLNPFVGMQNAVTRSPQHLTIEEAIAAYTINAAYVMRQENIVGTLEVGKEADFIVLDQNLFEIEPTEISKTQVLQTYLIGELVYER